MVLEKLQPGQYIGNRLWLTTLDLGLHKPTGGWLSNCVLALKCAVQCICPGDSVMRVEVNIFSMAKIHLV
jgi:hypothetical protein